MSNNWNNNNRFAPNPSYAQPQPQQQQNYQDPGQGAVMTMPPISNMGGTTPGVPAFYRQPYFPTAPFYSTDPNVGNSTLYQTLSFTNSGAGMTAGTSYSNTMLFDTGTRVIAFNAGVYITDASAIPVGWDRNDTYTVSIRYTSNNLVTQTETLGSTVFGSASRPGEIGGVGLMCSPGAGLQFTITPLISNLCVYIAAVCCIMMGPGNYNLGR